MKTLTATIAKQMQITHKLDKDMKKSKNNNVPVNVSVKKDLALTEKLVLDILKIYPKITYAQIAEKINKTAKQYNDQSYP